MNGTIWNAERLLREWFLCGFKILAQQFGKGMGGALPVQNLPELIVEHRWIRLISARETGVNRVPLGKNWRKSPVVFSLVPRSHGQWGCAT